MPAIRDLADHHRILFFSGKGGVGKTTLASATALARAQAGGRVLVVSTDPAHNLGHLWDRSVGAVPVTLWEGAGRLDGVELDPAAIAAEHLAVVGETMKKFVADGMQGQVDTYLAVVRDSPGTHESALMERIAQIVVDDAAGRYDLIVFDTAPTGHTARLMHLPDMMALYTDALISRRKKSESFSDAAEALGYRKKDKEREADIRAVLDRRRTLFTRFREHLSDTAATSFVLALTAERMPVLETIEFARSLSELGISVGALAVNRRTPPGLGEVFEQRRASEADYIRQLASALSAPIVEIEMLGGEPTGLAALEGLGRYL
ncbi:arsenite-transporting ATPase [Bowdeniella nasicola]|uniref:Arsenite-transporting ATPase n=1 Tax=Bowdeniella nasicola TaxID=208480 RepID=A0A1H3Y7J5_9ACTO|nr:ArsA family ATPase [Bowdeniella nasicola]SEA06818.1 arsenite-transporting ATPase [Bowdeniella nasicola]